LRIRICIWLLVFIAVATLLLDVIADTPVQGIIKSGDFVVMTIPTTGAWHYKIPSDMRKEHPI
jgi:hypothetical protein